MTLGPRRALVPVQDLAGQQLEILTRRIGDDLTIIVRGEIDLATHERLRSELDGLDLRNARSVDLCLTDLDFTDARGMCHLLDFADRTRASGRPVEVTCARPPASRLLALISLQQSA